MISASGSCIASVVGRVGECCNEDRHKRAWTATNAGSLTVNINGPRNADHQSQIRSRTAHRYTTLVMKTVVDRRAHAVGSLTLDVIVPHAAFRVFRVAQAPGCEQHHGIPCYGLCLTP